MHLTLLFLLLLPLLSLAQTDSSSQLIYTITRTATGKPTLVWTTPPRNAPHSEVPYHQQFTAYFNTIQTPLSGSIGLGNIRGRVGVSRSYPLNITQKPNISLSPSSTGVVSQDLNIYPDGNLKKPTWATIVASGGGTFNHGPTYSQNAMDLTSGTSSSANAATTVVGSSTIEASASSSSSTTSSTSSTSTVVFPASTSTTAGTSSSASTTVPLTEPLGDETASTSFETTLGGVGETPTTSSLTSTPGILVTPTTATTTSSSTPAGAAINTPTTTTQPGTNTALVETSTASTSLVSTPVIASTEDTVPSTLTTPA